MYVSPSHDATGAHQQGKAGSAPAAPVGRVFNIMRFALNDGPGIRTIVFLKGCPLDCWWCHNPEGIEQRNQVVLRPDRCLNCGNCIGACPHGAITRSEDTIVTSRDRCAVCGTCVERCFTGAREVVGREFSVPDLMKVVLRDLPFFEESGGGVTFSGGEPLLQIDFLDAALSACRSAQLHTAIETSGYAPTRHVKRVMSKTDLFLYDLKLLDDERHRRFTGVSNVLILENLTMLLGAGRTVIVRVPLVSGVNDDDVNIMALGSYLSEKRGVHEVHLLPFHEEGAAKYKSLGMTYRGEQFSAPGRARLVGAAEQLSSFGLAVTIGG